MARFALSLGPRATVAFATIALALVVAPLACVYPDYTFDLPEGKGGSGGKADAAADGASDATGDAPHDALADTPPDVPFDAGACTCFEAPAFGWTGPVSLASAPNLATLPSCGGAYAADAFAGHAGLTAPATCPACTCGDPTGVTCDPPLHVMHDRCASPACGWSSTTPIDAQACNAITFDNPGGACTAIHAIQVPASTPSGGTCAPAPAAIAAVEATWSDEARACSAAGVSQGKCTTGQVCAWDAEAGHKLCVWQKGDKECPASPSVYAEKHLYYGGIDDQRLCSACACGAPSGGTCSGSIEVFAQGATSCGGTPASTAPTGTCTTLAASVTAGGAALPLKWAPGTAVGRTCAASGGAPSGSAAPADPTTFCCIP